MINIENLVKRYGNVPALDGLSLKVRPGVVYGFLGPNGAGKTTTMRILSGLARADGGRATILGREVGGMKEDVRAFIGVLPEEPAFYAWMGAKEYLRDFVAPLYGLEARAAARRVDEMLSLVGLADVANRRIGGFSRGMRQRLGLAQAMLHSPRVLLLDEPVSALDPAGRKDILDLIDGLRGKTTILLSTHILADVDRVCDVIGVINKGRLVIQANRDALLEKYAQPLFEIEVEDGLLAWLERIKHLPFVSGAAIDNSSARVLVTDVRKGAMRLLASLAEDGLFVRRFEMVHPSLEDVFLKLTKNDDGSSNRGQSNCGQIGKIVSD
jgi:ABC-2 type transport system ATP-binding protein